jgi:hypothetical protein
MRPANPAQLIADREARRYRSPSRPIPGAVDALPLDRANAEVVPRLALDDEQRDAFAGHLDRS